MTGKKTN